VSISAREGEGEFLKEVGSATRAEVCGLAARWGRVSAKLATWAAGAIVRREAIPKPPPSPEVLEEAVTGMCKRSRRCRGWPGAKRVAGT
jgi:hypothetical protein